jgi:hypothetical protein
MNPSSSKKDSHDFAMRVGFYLGSFKRRWVSLTAEDKPRAASEITA